MGQKKRSKLKSGLIVFGVIIVISIIANAGGGDSSSSHSDPVVTDVTVVIPEEDSEKIVPRQSDSTVSLMLRRLDINS
jgi:hypothetical protein